MSEYCVIEGVSARNAPISFPSLRASISFRSRSVRGTGAFSSARIAETTSASLFLGSGTRTRSKPGSSPSTETFRGSPTKPGALAASVKVPFGSRSRKSPASSAFAEAAVPSAATDASGTGRPDTSRTVPEIS